VTTAPWKLAVAGPVHRAIGRLPAKVAIAVLDFLVGPLVENPQRVGKALRGDLKGLHARHGWAPIGWSTRSTGRSGP